MKKHNRTHQFIPKAIVLAVAGCFSFGPVQANPVGPHVVAGSAVFSTQGNTFTIKNSPGAIINWQEFSNKSNEITRFDQASAASSVLNRVVTSNPSQLFGTLQSNGRVFLINPAGILVGTGAVIDTAGFIASTLNLSDADFLAGKLNFTATPGAGKLENYGTISAPSGGSVYLVGAQVENHGIINAPNGEVLLAAGKTAYLIDTGTPGIRVEITADKEQVLNVGQLLAESGRVGMVGAIVKNSGKISVSNVTREGGRVFLKATQDTYVDKDSRIEASGTRGGRIEILGNRVALMDQAAIDASGADGGGTVLVGGDNQGKNPDVQNANITFVGKNVSLKADALQRGNGGKVIVWADDITRYFGSISAKGGAQSGNGGFVEVSGKRYLDFQGRVNTSAPNGRSGTLLLDPTDLTITNNSGTNVAITGDGFSTPFEGNGTPSTLDVVNLQNALLSGNVIVDAATAPTAGTGNITVAAPVAWANSNELTLRTSSSGGIAINQSITAASGGLKLDAGSGGVTQSAAGVIQTAKLGVVSKGDVVLNTASNNVAELAADLTAVAGKNFSYQSGSSFVVGLASGVSGIQTSGAAISLKAASGNITINKPITDATGALKLETLSGNISQASAGVIQTNTLEILASGNVSLTNALNRVNIFAASMPSTGSLNFRNDQSLTIGTAGGTSGIDFSNNAGGTIDIKTTSGDLTVAQVVSNGPMGGGQITLEAANILNVNNAITSSFNSTPSPIRLKAGAGGISSTAAGVISGNLEVLSVGNVALDQAANVVPVLSANVTGGTFSFKSAGNFEVNQAIAVNGVTASGNIKLQVSGLDKLLTVNKAVTSTAGNVSYSADHMAFNVMTSSGGAGTYIEVLPYTTASVPIKFMTGADVPGELHLSAASLANLTTPLLKVGRNTHVGGIVVKESIVAPSITAMSLITSGTISQDATKTISLTGLNADGWGGVSLNEANNITKLGGHTNAGNTFSFNNVGNVLLSLVDVQNGINSGSGNITLTTGGNLSCSGSAIVSTSGTFSATAATGINLLGNNAASTVALTNTGSGNITYQANQANLSAAVSNVGAGTIDLSNSGGSLVVGNAATATGNITLSSSGNVTLNTVTTSGQVNVTSSAGAILDGNAGSMNVSAGVINLNAATGIASSGDPLDVTPTTSIAAQTSSGSIYLATSGNLPVAAISAPGTVSLASSLGSIVDANGAATNIVAGVAELFAYSGIGNSDAIEMQVSVLNANNAMAGNVSLINAGALTVTNLNSFGDVSLVNSGAVTIPGTVSSTTGSVAVSSQGPLTVAAGANVEALGAGKNVTLMAGSAGASTVADVVTINGNVSAGGTITLAGASVGGSNVPAGAVVQIFTPPPAPVVPVAPVIDPCIVNPTLAGCVTVLPKPVVAALLENQGQTANVLDKAPAREGFLPIQFLPPLAPKDVGTPGGLKTFVGGVVGGEEAGTFGAPPAGEGRSGSRAGDQDGKNKRKFGQCAA